MGKQTTTRLLSTPDWPTTMRSRTADGRAIGVDRSVWAYRVVPMSPVSDASSPEAGLAAAEPILVALDELAAITPVRVARRSMARSTYRQIHVLLVNIPRPFVPPQSSPLAGVLAESFPNAEVDRRLLLFGVKLQAKISSSGLRSAVDSVVDTLVLGEAPLSDYDADNRDVDAALGRAGMTVPSDDDWRLAKAWFNHGRTPDVPLLVHSDHLHVFVDPDKSRVAEELGADRCEQWQTMPGQHSLAFGCVEQLDLPFVDAENTRANWVSALVASGAVCVSVRGKVEPATVTRHELRRHRKQFRSDITDRVSQGTMERFEEEELLRDLTDVEAAYSTETAPPSVVDTSIIACFSGRSARSGYDLSDVGRDAGLILDSMIARQRQALAETWLCSPVRANPHLQDLPAQTLACSGLPSLSVVGDRDGVLVGLTERDRQPAWLSPTAASLGDSLPLFLVPGQTGSGKTLFALWVAYQLSRIPNRRGEATPCVFIDPKMGSDHSAVVRAAGGQVASLDDLASSDGILDPIRFFGRSENGVEYASSMLMTINPWGSMRADYETPVTAALHYGVSKGATCVGEALRVALEAGVAQQSMVKPVFDLAEASSMFRACVGMHPGTNPLSAAAGITLIKVGNANLSLPDPGGEATATQQQRIGLALVRMMVYGSAVALTHRQGVVILDEAWTVLGAGRSEVEKLGRLARSQEVLPVLLTQRVSDAENAGLAGYISRGMILPITDGDEAVAACRMFGLEPTPERLGRIQAKATVGGLTADSSGAPNWQSMRALRDPDTGRVLRGTVGVYADLYGRAVPVEVTIPDWFLRLGSTNPEDIARRDENAAGLLRSARSAETDVGAELFG